MMTIVNRSRLSYKIAFAVKHPGQVVPYARRVCVDAWLRAKTRDHVSYYRAVMKYKAGRSIDMAVGSRSPNATLVESAATIFADHCFSADGGKVRCHSAIPQPRSSPMEIAPAIKGRINT